MKLILLAPIPVVFCWMTGPAPVYAQTYQHVAECTANNNEQSIAMQHSDWALLVSSTRWFLTNCRDLIRGPDDEAPVLSELGSGLTQQGNFDDAIPILQRCISIKSDAAYCVTSLGYAFQGLGRLADARSAYERAIAIGGYDQLNASAVAAAHKLLAALPPPPPPPPDPSPSDAKVPTTSVSEKFGTGFFVSDEGYILTNNHVIDGCSSVSTTDGTKLSVVSHNDPADLALLKSNIKPPLVATFGRSARVGDAVMAFGFPLPGLLTSEGNATTGIISALSGLNGDLTLIQITAPVQPGNSGGPLVDQHGRVVGVIVAKLDALEVAKATGDIPQNVNFAIRNNVVEAFLDTLGMPYQANGSTAKMGWPDVANAEKRMSVALVCTEDRERQYSSSQAGVQAPTPTSIGSLAYIKCGKGGTEVYLLSWPTGPATVTATLRCGDAVTLVESGQNGYYKVRTVDNVEGYISHYFLADRAGVPLPTP